MFICRLIILFWLFTRTFFTCCNVAKKHMIYLIAVIAAEPLSTFYLNTLLVPGSLRPPPLCVFCVTDKALMLNSKKDMEL